MEFNNIPQEYICPISLDIMVDPVICEDCHTYDKSSLVVITNGKSPITGKPMNVNFYIPNIALRNIIREYAAKNKIKLDEPEHFDNNVHNSTDCVEFEQEEEPMYNNNVNNNVNNNIQMRHQTIINYNVHKTRTKKLSKKNSKKGSKKLSKKGSKKNSRKAKMNGSEKKSFWDFFL